jgi:hypothetical protein
VRAYHRPPAMYYEWHLRIVNAKVAIFGERSIELTGALFAASAPGARVRAEELADGSLCVLEPKTLRHLTPRFHLMASTSADASTLFRGADGVVLGLPAGAPQALALVDAVRRHLDLGSVAVLLVGGPAPAELGLAGHPLLVQSAGSPAEAVALLANVVAAKLAREAPRPEMAIELRAYAALPGKAPEPEPMAGVSALGHVAIPRNVTIAVLAAAIVFVLLGVLRAVAL